MSIFGRIFPALGLPKDTSTMFNSGWKPALGWVAAGGAAVAYIWYPLYSLVIAWWYSNPLPPYPIETLMVLVTQALGQGVIHAVERTRGVPEAPSPKEPAAPIAPEVEEAGPWKSPR